LEDSVTEALRRASQEKRNGILDGLTDPSALQKTMVLLLRQQVVLLAMKHGRAPLPVSPALWKGLLRQGALDDLYELGNIARRFSFLGDERMLLAELRTRTSTSQCAQSTLSNESKIAAEDRPQIEEAHKCR
jgi:hypothetical protein